MKMRKAYKIISILFAAVLVLSSAASPAYCISAEDGGSWIEAEENYDEQSTGEESGSESDVEQSEDGQVYIEQGEASMFRKASITPTIPTWILKALKTRR